MYVCCVKMGDYDCGISRNVRKGNTTAHITRRFRRNLLQCVNEHNARLLLFILLLRLNESDLRGILVSSEMNIDYTRKNITWDKNKFPHILLKWLLFLMRHLNHSKKTLFYWGIEYDTVRSRF